LIFGLSVVGFLAVEESLMSSRVKFALLALAVGVLVTGAASAVFAADSVDPTGTWKWSVTWNNQAREMSVKLKLADGKLTGSVPGRDGAETPITDAEYKDGQVKFTVTREREGRKMTAKYQGKVSGDTIKGTIERVRNDQPVKTEWEAKRAK
jgi:hypothetical protein